MSGLLRVILNSAVCENMFTKLSSATGAIN